MSKSLLNPLEVILIFEKRFDHHAYMFNKGRGEGHDEVLENNGFL